MKSLDGTGQKRLHRTWRRRTEGSLALLLDSVQNPFNVGSIIRTAAAMRIDHVWLTGATEPADHPKTKKTALGADRYLTFSQCDTAEQAVREAQAQGYQVVGIELADAAVPLHEVAATDKVCLVLGHEERGLSQACMAACDAVAFIPMLGKIGSLNVATAAAIAMYEVRRQAWTR
jgi:tRNA (guanosine-2'-O-)-methyltransferase